MIKINNDEGIVAIEGDMETIMSEWTALTGTLHRIVADKIGAEGANGLFTKALFAAMEGSEEIAKLKGE